MLNIVLDNEVILELLSKSQNDTQHCFVRLQKSPLRFWLPCCLLSLLETQINSSTYQPLSTLLDNQVELLSSLAAHWREIPADCPNKTQALISLDATTLPSTTIIWTSADDFISIHPAIEWGDHEFVYSMLAQYEDEFYFIDLESQQLILRPQLEKQIVNVFKHGQYVAGPEVERLENELAAYVDAKYCLSVANSTDALLIALMALGVKVGDEVITSPLNFMMAVQMITLLGAKPVFVDIEPTTYTLNPQMLETAITSKTKAIIATNLCGQCADFHAINAIAQQHNISVIEEATQSFGATYHDAKSGTLGTLSCTSFSPSQPLGTYGDGGACFTNDDILINTMRQLRSPNRDAPIIGINSHLDTLQASLLLTKLAHFTDELKDRTEIAGVYNQLLEPTPIKIPQIASHNTSTYAQYSVEVNNRDDIQSALQKRGIPVKVDFPMPIHLQPAFASLNQTEGAFPVAEKVAQSLLSLPMHPYLTQEMQTEIVDRLTQAL